MLTIGMGWLVSERAWGPQDLKRLGLLGKSPSQLSGATQENTHTAGLCFISDSHLSLPSFMSFISWFLESAFLCKLLFSMKKERKGKPNKGERKPRINKMQPSPALLTGYVCSSGLLTVHRN